MKSRWKMNRIGFVNFWLYDEEDFEFVDGKLLLRGQNGSGKSITTQSFIPFILDGDRTPSRLDPFGSSDRKMEYYFLGEEGRDEATGYLYLEFKKEGMEEYRTIGIGQRAKRGKPMDFWGFIVLDGRRIGYDLYLYKEVGSAKIPYDKRELRGVLGEENVCTDSPSEYKKLVNQYVFGFQKAEQYEQFIKLLVKVRAPKLSKEFKPTKVYEILNDSLQTLSDEDLRAMVDAMEKMDEIQDSLDMLKRAFEDVKIIRNEYTRYNQFMLAKKAQGYLSKKQEVEKLRYQYEARQQQVREMQKEQQEKEHELEALSEQVKLAETERNGLLDTDLEETDRKLEKAKSEEEEAKTQEKRWEDKAEEYNEKIHSGERRLKKLKESLQSLRDELKEQKRELDERQDVIQWAWHVKVAQLIGAEQYEGADELVRELNAFRKQIEECKKEIQQYAVFAKQYDEAAEKLEHIKKQKLEMEQSRDRASVRAEECREEWISAVFDMGKKAKEWHPTDAVFHAVEEKVERYEAVSDAGEVWEILRADYEQQRQVLAEELNQIKNDRTQCTKQLEQTREELQNVQNQEELEPFRDEKAEHSRRVLAEAGIACVPFYKAVEFANGMEAGACARLEAQLQKAGILDGLVLAPKDYAKVGEVCPEFLDAVLYVKERGFSAFSKLIVNEELEEDLKETVECILSNIYEISDGNQGIYLGENGLFRQGMLAGRAEKDGEAEFVGQLARKRRKEQKIQQLQERVREFTDMLLDVENKVDLAEARMRMLEEEYRAVPDFSELNAALAKENACAWRLQAICKEYTDCEQQEQMQAQRKNQQYQVMLRCCKPFPYGRTEAEYDEVSTLLEEYREVWQRSREILRQIGTDRGNCTMEEDRIGQDEQAMEDAFVEKRRYSTRRKECEIQIRQLEEYLNRPENVERAKRLKELKDELEKITGECKAMGEDLIRLQVRIKEACESEPEQKRQLTRLIAEETYLRNYFEEDLSLKLVFDRTTSSLFECAEKAITLLRDSDRQREATDMLQSLNQVYQKHNGSLVNYGTTLEWCFDAADDLSEIGESFQPIRKRMRITSVWNGKKVYLEEFYQILKASIDETEQLIQQKDRELFEDILSQTISQQLTDRIAESRKWVEDMSKLMKEMDTSMGLSFSLDWRPRTAENDAELDTVELEQILLREHDLLTTEDMEKVASHFRSKIRTEKMRLEENEGVTNYMELVRDALDYRKWFAFQMYFRRGEEPRKPLTNAAFNRFSGGEKAMAMYVPLFASVNAQYKKAENEEHPRMIALDEAFAGVDDKNISSMFELVHKLDFDYIMNSQALWGCYETVKGIRIAELIRPLNSQIVSVIRYTWNGHERILDVQ